MTLTRETVLTALNNIQDPVSSQDIQSAGLVRALTVESGVVRFVLEIDPSKSKLYESVRLDAEAKIKGLDGCKSVSIVLTAHENKKPPELKTKKSVDPAGAERIPGVKHIIAVASGKGGVGKTTSSANLGMSMARLGYSVALVDADIGLRNLDLLLGLENRVVYTAMEVLEGECRLEQALIRDKRWRNLALLPISKNRQRYN